MMIVSKEGVEFIAKHEGLILEAYDDFQPRKKITDISQVMGTLTIGYGHTGPDVFVGQTINLEKASELLSQDLQGAQFAVNDLNLGLNQNHFDALVSWAYNTGWNNLSSRSLIKAIRRDKFNYVNIDYWWNRYYITSKGVKLPGLVRRRREESELYIYGHYA